MNQIIAIALGGSFGAVLRYLVSSGVYQWLGRGFPYGTLAVNVIGSFLLGLLTEALIIHRIPIAHDYRAAILIGFIGAFTTFSTFSLETFLLLEQGSHLKAFTNIVSSVAACLLAIWLGLLASRALFYWSDGVIVWQGHVIPYALLVINLIGAFLIGFLTILLYNKASLEDPYAAAIGVVVGAAYLAFSGLYIVLFLIDQKYSIANQLLPLAVAFTGNTLLCLLCIWFGYLAGKGI